MQEARIVERSSLGRTLSDFVTLSSSTNDVDYFLMPLLRFYLRTNHAILNKGTRNQNMDDRNINWANLPKVLVFQMLSAFGALVILQQVHPAL